MSRALPGLLNAVHSIVFRIPFVMHMQFEVLTCKVLKLIWQTTYYHLNISKSFQCQIKVMSSLKKKVKIPNSGACLVEWSQHLPATRVTMIWFLSNPFEVFCRTHPYPSGFEWVPSNLGGWEVMQRGRGEKARHLSRVVKTVATHSPKIIWWWWWYKFIIHERYIVGNHKNTLTQSSLQTQLRLL